MATHQWAWRAWSSHWAERCQCRWPQTLSSRKEHPRSSSWPRTWWTRRCRSWAWSIWTSRPSFSPSGTLEWRRAGTRRSHLEMAQKTLKCDKTEWILNCRCLRGGRHQMRTRDPVCVCVGFRGTFNGNSAIKRRRFPCDHGTVLANRCAFDILRRVGHIWVQLQLENGRKQAWVWENSAKSAVFKCPYEGFAVTWKI